MSPTAQVSPGQVWLESQGTGNKVSANPAPAGCFNFMLRPTALRRLVSCTIGPLWRPGHTRARGHRTALEGPPVGPCSDCSGGGA